jgi:hypothetical protein
LPGFGQIERASTSTTLLCPTPIVTGRNVSGDATQAQAASRIVHGGVCALRVRYERIG